jgi:hypothetical protein
LAPRSESPLSALQRSGRLPEHLYPQSFTLAFLVEGLGKLPDEWSQAHSVSPHLPMLVWPRDAYGTRDLRGSLVGSKITPEPFWVKRPARRCCFRDYKRTPTPFPISSLFSSHVPPIGSNSSLQVDIHGDLRVSQALFAPWVSSATAHNYVSLQVDANQQHNCPAHSGGYSPIASTIQTWSESTSQFLCN